MSSPFDISRRTFFFLGFGILKGKVLYELVPKIIIPPPPKLYGILYHDNDGAIGEWNGIARQWILPAVKKLYERDDLLYKILNEQYKK